MRHLTANLVARSALAFQAPNVKFKISSLRCRRMLRCDFVTSLIYFRRVSITHDMFCFIQVIRQALENPAQACFIVQEAIESYYNFGGVSKVFH